MGTNPRLKTYVENASHDSLYSSRLSHIALGLAMPISKSDIARLNKAKAAMKRAEYAPHASRGLRDARKLLKPLVEKNIPEAQYLAASFALAHEFKSDADFNKWRYKLIHKAAESGYARAQFALGQAWHYGI
jgi:hypothetical protein